MSEQPWRIAVVGAGAVGSALGGFLARAGHAVTLVGRAGASVAPGSHLARVQQAGLIVDGIRGRHECDVRVTNDIEAAGPCDLIIITVKSFDTEEAARSIVAAGGDCPVLHLQNGIGNFELLRDILGARRVLSGMIIIGFAIPEAGRVEVTVYGGPIAIGHFPGAASTETQTRVVELFASALPFEVQSVDDIETRLWSKLLYNSALNPLGAIFGVPYGRLLDPAAQAIIHDILSEAFAVAHGLGVRLAWQSAAEYQQHLRSVQIPATADHFPSMGADLRAGKSTEIEYLNGAIQRAGERLGLATPVNAMLTRQIRFLENSPRGD